MPTLIVDSRDAIFAACAQRVDALVCGDFHATFAMRDPDARAVTSCAGTGSFEFRGGTFHFRVEDVGVVGTADTRPQSARRLHLTAATREALLDFVEHSVATFRASTGFSEGDVHAYSWDDDHWLASPARPLRPMSSLFLPGTAAEDVLCDLKAFLAEDARRRYARLHVAPVRVYLLRGVWGSGKSSLVHCLASETGHGTSGLAFSSHMTDRDLLAAVKTRPRGTFLVIEDVDALFRGRAKADHGVDFGSVLAMLDGAASREPLVVFLTTNHADRLDPALRRRVDYVVDFAHATRDQCRRMFDAFFPGSADFDALWRRVTSGGGGGGGGGRHL